MNWTPSSAMAVLFLFLTTHSAVGQLNRPRDYSFKKGELTLTAGAGLKRSFTTTFTTTIDGAFFSEGTINYGNNSGYKAVMEKGIWKAGKGILSLGVEAGGSFTEKKQLHSQSSIIIVALRSAYHVWWKAASLDTYAGVSAGPGFKDYRFTRGTDFKQKNVTLVPGVFGGATYYVSQHAGINLEAGYDITVVQAGILFKFN